MISATAWHLMALCILDLADTKMACFLLMQGIVVCDRILYIQVSTQQLITHTVVLKIKNLTTKIC